MISTDPTPIANDISRAPTDPLIRKARDVDDDLADVDALILESYNQAVEECARLLTKRPDCTPGLMRNLKRREIK
jgi:hypothetical protein